MMPQMSPMSWMMMYFMFTLFMIVTMNCIYPSMTMKMEKVSITKKMMNNLKW